MTMPWQQAVAQLGQQMRQIQADLATIKRNQRAAQLDNASIENGALVINDANGNPQIMLGLQPDGTYAHVALNGPAPSVTPSVPLVSPGILGLYVIWDGAMSDGSQPTADNAGVQVHVSTTQNFTPGPATLSGTLPSAGLFGVGNLTAGTTYYVALVAINASGNTSQPSAEASGIPQSVPQGIPAGSINGGQIQTGTITGANIAAGTIAAGNLVVGIVVAGIVDATTIKAPTIIGSTILGYASTNLRGDVVYDFETSTQGWQGASGNVSLSSAWASTGQQSLLLTANGAGQPHASVAVASALPTINLDPVSLSVDLFAPSSLSNVYVGIQWWDAGNNLIRETNSPDTAFSAGQAMTLTVGDIAPSTAVKVGFTLGDHFSDTNGTLLYADNIQIPGNLAFSAASAAGTDAIGNGVPQGIAVVGLPGLLEAFLVTDPFGNVLSVMDTQGNITGETISAAQDVIIAGESFLNGYLYSLPQGPVAYGCIPTGSLPTTATSSELAVYELDASGLDPNRMYQISLLNTWVSFSASGTGEFARLRVRGTIDGTTPTTSSPLICEALLFTDTNTAFNGRTSRMIIPSTLGLSSAFSLRLLLSVDSGGAYTVQIGQAWGTGFQVDNGGILIEDMGPALPVSGTFIGSGSSGGSGVQNYVKTYTAQHSYCYQGSDGANPNQKINQGGNMTQGGDLPNTFNGHAKTWIVFNTSQIQSDLSGATITKVQVKLNNNHTWYNSGMTVALGWSNHSTTFGNTEPDPTSGGVDNFESHINEGQTKTFDATGAGIGTAYQNGSATSLVLFKNSNNLNYYGYFSGASQSSPPQLIISYSK